MQRAAWLFLALAGLLPAAARAQTVLPPPSPNRLFMEPYAGAYFDAAEDTGPDFDNAGPMAGIRLGLRAAPRLRLFGDLAYAQVNRAGEVPVTDVAPLVYDARSFMATAGLEVETVPGQVGGSFSLQGGALWRERQFTRSGPDDEGYASEGVIVPGIALRAALTSRTDLKLGLQDYITLDETRHNPALTLGISFR